MLQKIVVIYLTAYKLPQLSNHLKQSLYTRFSSFTHKKRHTMHVLTEIAFPQTDTAERKLSSQQQEHMSR